MLAGEPIPELLSLSGFARELGHIEEVSRRRIYRGGDRFETVLIASRTLNLLLDAFAAMLLRRERTSADAELSLHDRALLDVFCRERGTGISVPRERELWVRALMDHIASLTDRSALAEARMVNGDIG
jgi:dGTP triphosphohydrolase